MERPVGAASIPLERTCLRKRRALATLGRARDNNQRKTARPYAIPAARDCKTDTRDNMVARRRASLLNGAAWRCRCWGGLA
eukprot:3415393-Lingulodinium_polyedra.AAC.1